MKLMLALIKCEFCYTEPDHFVGEGGGGGGGGGGGRVFNTSMGTFTNLLKATRITFIQLLQLVWHLEKF